MDGSQNKGLLKHFRVIVTWQNYLLKLYLCCLLIESSTQLFCSERFSYIWYKHSDTCSFKLYWQYLCRSWWPSGMIPEKVTWVQFPSRISSVYNKLLQISNLVFQFLIENPHIRSYKFSYRTSDQEICSAMLYKFYNSLPVFSFFCADLVIPRKNPILGYICKVVNSGCYNYVICIS